MQYYHNLITDQSFQFLQELQKQYRFILIGGWAVFAYTGALKSKDIDIIVEYDELSRLKERYVVGKNERLKKYEIKLERFDIDIYLPHYSGLGIPIEAILYESKPREGFRVPPLEILLLLKQWAYQSRQGTPKGEKDKLDILSLAALPEFDWPRYREQAQAHRRTELVAQLRQLLQHAFDAPELGWNQARTAKLKKKILPGLAG